MTATFQPDDHSIRARLQQYAAADAYRAQAVNTQELALLNSYYAAYPTADPSVIAPLVKQGFAPNDPTVQKIMLQHTKQQQHHGLFDKIGDVVGGAVSKVGKGLGFVAGSTASGIGGLARGAVRSALVAVESPLQEVQDFSRAAIYEGLSQTGAGRSPAGAARGFGSALQQSGTSSGVEALSDLFEGKKVDLGTGYLPGGQVEEEVRRKAGRLQIEVGGHIFGGPGNPAITLGRVIGSTVTEPGTQPNKILSGLIDGAVAWYGDPVAALGSAAKDAEVGGRIARALPVALDEGLGAGLAELAVKPSLSEAVSKTSQGSAARAVARNTLGVISGHRPTTIPSVTETALSKGGRRIIDHLAEETDPQAIYEATKRKVPIAVSNELAEARTPQEVLSVLNSHVGEQITQFPEWNGLAVKAGGRPSVRLLGMMPGRSVDPSDLDNVYEGVDRTLKGAGVSPEVRTAALRKVMATPDPQSVAPTLIDIFKGVQDDIASKLRVKIVREAGESDEAYKARVAAETAGAQKAKAVNLTRMFVRDGEKMRAYLGDEITANDKAAGVVINGQSIPAQSPYQMLEFLNSEVPLPNMRDLRRATSTLNRLVDTPGWRKTAGIADSLLHVWKPLTILRPALTLRLVGEHQAEMAGAGLDSFFSHPLSFVAAVVSNPEKAEEFINAAKDHPSYALRHPLQAVEAAGSKAVAPFVGKVRQGDVFGNTGAESALHDLMSSLTNESSDLAEVGRGSLRGQRLYTMADGPAYTRAWHNALGDVPRDPVWRKVVEGRGNLDDVKRWFWGEGQGYRLDLAKRIPELGTPAGADAYIDSLYRAAMYRTGGDTEVLDALATGHFNGKAWAGLDDGGKWGVSDEFARHLDNVVGPDSVKGHITMSAAHGRSGHFDDAMNYLFDHLLQGPFDKLVTEPAINENYWRSMEMQLPHMDAATRAQVLENAGKEGVGPGEKVLQRLRELPQTEHPTIHSLDDAHMIAAKHALNEAKKVLYSQVEKSQFFDAMRTVFPFGEAWRQAMSRWAKIAWNNPNVVVGGQKIVTGLEGNGFFHKDENGDEVFNMPFGRNISKLVLGLSVPLLTGESSHGASVDMTSPVSGLSMMADILPGVGPVVQVGAGAILPDTPDWDWARNFISPRGQQDYSQGVLESTLPGFVKSFMQVMKAGNPRQFAGYVSDASNYLVSTGEYDMTDPTGQEQARMLKDAKSIAKGMFVLKGLGQAVAPASPQLQSVAKTSNGHLIEQTLLAQQFNKWEQDPAVGYDGAVQRFLDRYGSQAFLSTQGKTLALLPNMPLSEESSKWERAHPDIVKQYDKVWGLFAPTGDKDSFDYSAYQRQMKRGARVPITADQRIALAQIHLASHQYAIAKSKVGDKPTAQERAWLAAVKQTLMEEYPAYGKDVPGLPNKFPPDDVIAQLARAVVDPRLSRTPEAKAAALYLQARQEAIAQAQVMGATSTNGSALGIQAAAPLRAWLTEVGNVLVKRTPGFAPIMDSVFAREIT